MPDNLRSRTVTQGVQARPQSGDAPAVGFGEADFDKPIIGVANGYSTITPCNSGLDLLARRRRGRDPRGGRHASAVRHDHRKRRHFDGNRGG